MQPRVARKEAVVEVTREVVLEAPLDEVWEALTDPGAARGVVHGGRRGAGARGRGGRGAPTRRLHLGRGHVAIEIEEVETGTRVVVTETGEPGWNAVFSLRALAHAYA